MTQVAAALLGWAVGFAVYGTFAWRRAVVMRRTVDTLLAEAASNVKASEANLAQADLHFAKAEVLHAKSTELHADVTRLLTPARVAGTSDTR